MTKGEASKTLYLIRHTTLAIEKGICYGQADVPVSSSFDEEARCIKARYDLLPPIDLLYASPLSRCCVLAERLSALPAIVDRRLMELDFGRWEMRPWDDIDPAETQSWFNDHVHVPCANGESFVDLYSRVGAFLEMLRKRPETRIAIIAHGGVIRAAMAYIHQTPLEKAFDLAVGYGEIMETTY